MSENANKDIIRGHVNIIILKALLEGEKYGYEIGKYIESKSEGDYILKQPTLYSSLKRLENKKLIQSYWGDSENTNGGRRKYFKLTDIGKKLCSENLTEWNKSKRIIDKLISNNQNNNNHLNTKILRQNFNNNIKNNDNSPIPLNINSQQMENQQEKNIAMPEYSRTRQLFSEDDKKDSQYKMILSKLLSNVKNDSEKEQEQEKNEDKEKINLNQIKINIPDMQENIQENKLDNENKDSEPEQINKINNSENLLNDKNYSLLPSSSEYTFSGFNKIQYEMMEQGFKLTRFNDAKKQPKQFLLIHKINFIAAVILYLIMVLQTAFIYLYWQPLINIDLKFYVYTLAILLVLPVISALCYAINPDKRTKKRYIISNSIISSLMVFMVLFLGIVSIALLFNIDTKSHYEIILKIVIPLIYSLNFILYSVIWGILYKTKKCFK